MEKYDGAKSRSEWPIGGGSNNKRRCGDEVHNFTNIGGHVYGFCQPAANTRKLSLKRIQVGWDKDSLPDVLVVFVAVDRQKGGQRVVGWYRGALLYESRQICTSLKRGSKKFFYATTRSENAVLLRVEPYERNWVVPAGSGGIGQANICYLYDPDGSRKDLAWADKILKKIEKF